MLGQAAAEDPQNDPTVEIQTPEAGSTVTGQVNLTGEASDP